MTSKGSDGKRAQSKLEFDPPLRPAPSEKEEPAQRPPPDLGSLPLFPEPAPPKKAESEEGKVIEGSASSETPEPPTFLEVPSTEPSFHEPVADDLVVEEQPSSMGVTFQSRLWAGLADLAIHTAVVVVLLAGQALLTPTPPSLALLPAYGVFLLAFSFLYTVVPLAFWGQTPGMSAVGLQVRAADGENLTFPQPALRWGAGLVTCALLGLPLLMALSGRSLGDRLAQSNTIRLTP